MKNDQNKCNIIAKNKLRNGYPNWWCLTHHASGRGKKGKKLEKCEKADLPKIKNREKIKIDLEDYPGGVGIWGALDAVFDSKREIPERGVHVHLRRKKGGEKEVDKTFKEVYIKVPSTTKKIADEKWVRIDEETACAYTSSIIFNKEIKVLKCKYCGEEHIDAEYFSVHPHKKHFCNYCGRDFFDVQQGISNPIFHLQEILKDKMKHRKLKKVRRRLKINQQDYPGGIQIWGSNPAIVWTAARSEESGIHVHLFKDKAGAPEVDETFGYVEIDGIELDDDMIRYFMVQNSLSYLKKYVASLICPECGRDHFDKDENALNPHKIHECEHCGNIFEDHTRFKGVVSNPILQQLKYLEKNQRDF